MSYLLRCSQYARLYNHCFVFFTHFVTVCYVTFVTFYEKLIFLTIANAGRFSKNATRIELIWSFMPEWDATHRKVDWY